MTEPMTLEEAVRVTFPIPHRKKGVSGMLATVPMDALCVLRAHAERTIAARSGEQEEVRHLRDSACELTADEMIVYYTTREVRAVLAHLDTLTAERDAARQEFAEWLDASRKALDAHAEVVAERDAARESLRRLADDVMRCIDASWRPHHGREYGAHLGNILAEFVGGLTADRDRLAACVERVRGLANDAAEWSERDERVMLLVSDILAALEGVDAPTGTLCDDPCEDLPNCHCGERT
jgi:hypothetical protein